MNHVDIDELERLNADYREAQKAADAKADERAMAIARAVIAGPKGTQAEIARRLDMKDPTVFNAVRRGRILLAEREVSEGAATAA